MKTIIIPLPSPEGFPTDEKMVAVLEMPALTWASGDLIFRTETGRGSAVTFGEPIAMFNFIFPSASVIDLAKWMASVWRAIDLKATEELNASK